MPILNYFSDRSLMNELEELIKKYSPIYNFIQDKHDVGRLLLETQSLHMNNHRWPNLECSFIRTHAHIYYCLSLGWDERCDMGEHLMSLCDEKYERCFIATYMRYWFGEKDPDQFHLYIGKNAVKQGVKQSRPEVGAGLYKGRSFVFDKEIWPDTKHTPVEAFIKLHADAYLTAGYSDQALRYEGVEFMLKHREMPILKDTLIAYLQHWHGVDDLDLFEQYVGHVTGVVEI